MLYLFATSLLVNLSPWFVDANLYSINKIIRRKMMGSSIRYHCKDFSRTWRYIWVTRYVCLIRSSTCLPFAGTLLCVFTFWVPWFDVRYDFRITRCCSLVLQLFVGGLISYLLYLFAHSGFLHMLCCVFALFFFVLCTLYCQCLWIVHFLLHLWYSLTFIYPVNIIGLFKQNKCGIN
jgi:hypothetical protein